MFFLVGFVCIITCFSIFLAYTIFREIKCGNYLFALILTIITSALIYSSVEALNIGFKETTQASNQ